MTTAGTETPTAADAGRQFKITWYRLLDSLQSRWNRYRKLRAARKRWGKNADLPSLTRSGRRYSRVEFIASTTADSEGFYLIRSEPGWEWVCENCRTYSLVPESMIATWRLVIETNRLVHAGGKVAVEKEPPAKWHREILHTDLMKRWEQQAASCVGRGFKPPKKPTPATAGCPNCSFRPGAPE